MYRGWKWLDMLCIMFCFDIDVSLCFEWLYFMFELLFFIEFFFVVFSLLRKLEVDGGYYTRFNDHSSANSDQA